MPPFGVRHETLKRIAKKLGVSETKAAHTAIGRLYRDLFEEGSDFDFPSDATLRQIDRSGEDHGAVVSQRDLSGSFDDPPDA